MKIIMDDGHCYTEEQYRKDLIRMFDSVRSNDFGKANCKSVKCSDCPLKDNACPIINEYDFYECFYENFSEVLKSVMASSVIITVLKLLRLYTIGPKSIQS